MKIEEADKILERHQSWWYKLLFSKNRPKYWVFLKEKDGNCFSKFGVLNKDEGDWGDWSTKCSSYCESLKKVYGPFHDVKEAITVANIMTKSDEEKMLHLWCQ